MMKKIVVVFDNAPTHSQTEVLVPESDELVLPRLGSYSPKCNPIENCPKGHINDYLALRHGDIGRRSVS